MGGWSALMDRHEQERDRRKAYFVVNGRWELGLVDMFRPLGEILLRYREEERSIRLGRGSIRRELKRLTPMVRHWREKYGEWRASQGNPLHGSYADLPPVKSPFVRLVSAAKEWSYRTELQEKDLAMVALYDMLAAAEDYVRLLHARAENKRKEAASEARKTQQVLVLANEQPVLAAALEVEQAGESVEEEVFCLKCRRRTASKDLQDVVLKNGTPAVRCWCAACGTLKFRFTSVKKRDNRSG